MPKKNQNLQVNANIDYVSIGERLKKIRESQGKTVAAFSSSLGVSASYVSGCEHGVKPSIEFIMSISSKYNISLDYILMGKESDSESANNPALNEMIILLKNLMNHPDPDIRAWTKIQFNKAFKDLPDFEEDAKRST
ncbi:MAG: helix-turn-helix transcriptional regulator [Acidaminococcaceae bacterium]|nr:helix-turn-helix transcriptional regulator [Acidaminococcaceae bacterium]MBQ5346185.1 helix-turn-helix transcriptional regulator [Acidaminococcaceae bacterium]